MDTYLLWALNTLFQELFDSQFPTPNSSASTSFQSFLASPATESAGTNTLPTASSVPTPEWASSSVHAAIQNAAAATGLSSTLLKAVATVESGLDPTAVSSAGAVGLMQLMPATAQSLGVNPNNTAQNALGGAEYLKSLLNQFNHNVSLALAAYNAGPGAVEQYGGIPPYAQTQQYVNDVLAAYRSSIQPSTTPANSSWTG